MLHRQYQISVLSNSQTFCQLQNQALPYIVISKSMADLCWVRLQNNNSIVRSVNLAEGKKSEVLKEQECHLQRATLQRSFYTNQCERSHDNGHSNNLVNFRKSQPNSFPATFHYSFDYVQQVLNPANPMQRLMFLNGVKYSVFTQKGTRQHPGTAEEEPRSGIRYDQQGETRYRM